MSVPPRIAPPVPDPSTFGSCSTQILVDSLRSTVSIAYAPLARVVARLDTTRPMWVLTLDTDSPSEDHCWAMLDVLKVLNRGRHAAEYARTTTPLSLVRNRACPRQIREDPQSSRSPLHE